MSSQTETTACARAPSGEKHVCWKNWLESREQGGGYCEKPREWKGGGEIAWGPDTVSGEFRPRIPLRAVGSHGGLKAGAWPREDLHLTHATWPAACEYL